MMLFACVLFALYVQAVPQAAPAVDPAIQAAVERFYETQQQEDIEGYLALWSAKARRPPVDQLKYIFSTGDDKFSDIQITNVSETGGRVRVRVQVRRERTGAPRAAGGPPPVFTSVMRAALTFEKEGDGWKLLREGQPADELAIEIMDAKDDAERDVLLAREPDLIGPALLTAFARLAGAASMSQNYPLAQKIYEQLIVVARRGGFKKEEGEALQNIANALYFQRRFPEALSTYERRLALERERGDEAGIAASLGGIATIRYSYAEYTEALARYREALAIHERLDDVAGIAVSTTSIGNIAYLQGDFHTAIASYRRSLELARTMFDADGESRNLEGLGRVYMAQGDYAGALEAFDTVLKDKRMQHARSRLGIAAQSVGEVHFRLGNIDAAKASYQVSRDHFEAAKDMVNAGRVLQGLALTELVAARFSAAEDLYKRSSAICISADDKSCSAAATAGLAYAQNAQDKFWDAVASYRTAINEFTALGRREEAARCEVGLAQALTGAEDFAGAIEAAVRARHTAMAIENDDVIWRALTAEARAIRKNGDTARALGVARASLSALDRLEAAASERPGASLTRDAAAALATFAVLQAATGDAAGAFATAERLRALEIRARLATNERDISAPMTADERDRERALAAQVLTRLAQLSREKGLPKPDAARVAALEKDVAAAKAERAGWMRQLFEKYPDLRRVRGLEPPPDLTSAATFLRDRGDLLVSFVLDEDDLLVLTVARQDVDGTVYPALVVEAHLMGVKRRQVAGLVFDLQHPPTLADLGAWRKASSAFLSVVPPDVMKKLASASNIMVIPHDVLWRVPLEALPVDGGFLLDRAKVTLGGSLRGLLRASDPVPPTDAAMIGVGVPEIAAARAERLKQSAPGWTLRPRDEGQVELSAAAATYTAEGSARLFEGAAATERTVRAQLRSAPVVVHIAAPFRLNPASPLFSPVLLSAPIPPDAPTDSAAPSVKSTASRDPDDDGAWELREIIGRQDFQARVVIFSDGAALSMRDGAAAADVLQWAWLTAGVPSQLVARWHTPSPGRESLLGAFHAHLQRGMAPAAALRDVLLAIRARGDAAPVHWAGWMLLGRDPDSVTQRSSR